MISMVRFLFFGILLGLVVCWFMYLQTKQPHWRQRAINILKWGIVIGLLGFGAVILRRAAVFF